MEKVVNQEETTSSKITATTVFKYLMESSKRSIPRT